MVRLCVQPCPPAGTDILCLLIFVVIVGGVMGIGIWALSNGNIDQILYPADYLGNYCGKPGTDLSDRPYAFYPQLDSDIQDQYDVIIAGYCARRRRAHPSLAHQGIEHSLRSRSPSGTKAEVRSQITKYLSGSTIALGRSLA